MKLDDICILITDGSHSSPKASVDGYPMFSVKDMNHYGFNYQNCKFVSKIDYEKLVKNNCKPKINDIVVAKDGSYLKTAFVISEEKEIVLLSSIAILRPKTELVVPEYLKYFLKSESVFRLVSDNYVSGTGLKRIILRGIKKIPINLPELTIQQNRSELLVKLEEILSLRTKKLELLDDLIKSRFVEMFGDPVKNEKGWPTKDLKSLCNKIGDGLHGTPQYDENGEYPFINGNNLVEGKIVITPNTKMINREEYERIFIKLESNAILLSINGTLGKLAFYNGEKVALGKSACYCNLKETLNKNFVFGLMNSESFLRFLDESSTKSTIKNVGLKAIREYQVILPSKELQIKFADFIQHVDKLKSEVQKSLNETQVLYNSLMQRYFE